MTKFIDVFGDRLRQKETITGRGSKGGAPFPISMNSQAKPKKSELPVVDLQHLVNVKNRCRLSVNNTVNAVRVLKRALDGVCKFEVSSVLCLIFSL